MSRMAQGRGIPRSLQIFRTNRSLISLCLGTALRLFSSGWCHQEWLPPSRSHAGSDVATDRGASQGQRQLLVAAAGCSAGVSAVYFQGFLQHLLQRGQ